MEATNEPDRSGENLSHVSGPKVPPRDNPIWQSPMYQQYWSNKDQIPSEILLFYRMGDFYELFAHDAIIAAPLLGIQLTARNKDKDIPVPMCGVPVHALSNYVKKILAQNKKIALCEQVEEAGKAIKLVKREIVQILTPGLPIDLEHTESDSACWGIYIYWDNQEEGSLHLFDLLRGETIISQFKSSGELIDLCFKFSPKEYILSKSNSEQKEHFEKLIPKLKTQPRSAYIDGNNSRELLENYLSFTQRCDSRTTLKLIGNEKELSKQGDGGLSEYAYLSGSVIEQWGIQSHLFEILNKCASSMGARQLKYLLNTPLQRTDRIKVRQQLFQSFGNYQEILNLSRQLYDFERLLGRFRLGVESAIEIFRLQQSLKTSQAILKILNLSEPVWEKFFQAEDLQDVLLLQFQLKDLFAELDSALDLEKDFKKMSDLSELFKVGYDKELDRLKEIKNGAQEWLNQYQEKLRKQSDISSLKVRYNRIFGYYIEVTKIHAKKVPEFFEKKQSMVNAERYVTDELKNKEQQILGAEAQLQARARYLIQKIRSLILEKINELRSLGKHMAWIDALAGVRKAMQELKRFGPWVEPELKSSSFFFDFQECRHPVIEKLEGNFVANSLSLGGEESNRLLLLTGPNMAGKSTLMRQMGVNLLLAQCGFWVPAKSAKLSPASAFFSRMGASDNIFAGQSTFMLEMSECAEILDKADSNSFILIDEIGRGTSTQDGLAIAKAVLEYLHSEIRALCIFATHYQELNTMTAELPAATNASMAIKEWKNSLIFLRQLRFEAAQNSYGIHVAKLAGLPKTVLEKAKQNFFAKENSQEQLGLFIAPKETEAEEKKETNKLEEKLKEIELDELSPKEAWLTLEKLKKTL